MTDTRDDGGQVYPSEHKWNQTYDPGITRRDWLAGLAMQAYIARGNADEDTYADVAMWAYRQADAMIREGKSDG